MLPSLLRSPENIHLIVRMGIDRAGPVQLTQCIQPRSPLLAAEVVQHPEFKNVLWDLKPSEKGKLAVAQGRGGPFDIAYEVHGQGPIHMVVCLPFPFIDFLCLGLELAETVGLWIMAV